MAHRLLWVVAVLLAALALVGGCVNVKVPEGPYVVAGDYAPEPSPKDRERVGKMDRQALEEEVLRLTAENDRLCEKLGEKDREIKQLKKDKDQLEDRVEALEDQIKDLRRR